MQQKKKAEAEEILATLTNIMRGKTSDHTVVNRRVRLEEATEDGKRVSETFEPVAVKIPVKLADRMKAAELLGKSTGLFREKGEAAESALVFVVDDIAKGGT